MSNLAACRADQAKAAEARSAWAEAAVAYREAADLCVPEYGEDDEDVVAWRAAADKADQR